MPTSFDAVLVILLFLIPGFIARGVLSSIYPSSEPSEARLVLTTIALSCINYGLWSWLLALAWKGGWYQRGTSLALLVALVLFLSPVGVTLAVGRFMRTDAFRKMREVLGIRHPTPKSWDYFFGKGLPCWVVATLKSGRVIGGYYGTDSFAASFPAEEDLYLEKLCNLTPDGRLNGITPLTLGGIMRMQDVQLLELFEYVPEEQDGAG
jgi:hypothetical protein